MNANRHTRILSLVCAALVLALPGATAAAAEATARSVSVSGQGEIQAEPDRAVVTLGIESRKPGMEDARAEVTKTVDALLRLTRDLKIDPKYVRSTRINVQPEYNWDNDARERNLIGYYVSRQVEIDLHELDKLGTLIERAFDLGANQAGEPRLDSSRRRELEREALAKAVADARLNAEVVAKAAGGRLGAAHTISASSGFVSPPIPMQRTMVAAMAKEDAAASYQSGQMIFNATVQIQYDLIVPAVQ